MNHFRIFIRLVGIMAIVSTLAIGLTAYFLYVDGIEKYGEHLTEMVSRSLRNVNAVIGYQIEHIKKNPIEGHGTSSKYVHNEVVSLMKRAESIKQGQIEITVGFLKNNKIEWVIRSFQNSALYVPIEMGHMWAVPMQLALKTKSSGIIKAKDYSGRKVLASYTYIESLDMGIVAKANLNVITSRFIRGAVKASVPAFITVILGVILFLRVTSPIINKLEQDKENYRRLYHEIDEGEKKLAESEHRLKCFFDAAFEGIVISDKGIFIDCNKRFAAMFGYTVNEVIGMPIADLVFKEDLSAVLDNIKMGYEKPYEHRAIDKDGNMVIVEVHGKTVQYQGRPARITVIHDLSAQKKAEKMVKEMHERQHHTSKMEAIGNFASGIAHDLNNALTPIVGNCDLILNDQTEVPTCDRHRKYVLGVLAAAETAALLVHRIQKFTRKNGSMEKLIPLKLEGCLKETFEFLRSMTPTSIEMELFIEKGIKMIAATDVTIKQILMNLCRNAAQSMPDDEGRITITVSNEVILVERHGILPGNFVKMEVEDDGEGMTSQVMSRALDPYYSTNTLKGGSGLGLSVVNGIVISYSGFVRLQSEVGEGTKVVIYIPAIEDAKGHVIDCKIDEPVEKGNQERILFIDDQEAVIEAATKILESLNYRVKAYKSSIMALEEFERHPDDYDVVVTDLVMPEMTGLVLTNEIKKVRPEIGIILCSGLGSNGRFQTDLYADSVSMYLTKPITRREYGEALATVLKKGE